MVAQLPAGVAELHADHDDALVGQLVAPANESRVGHAHDRHAAAVDMKDAGHRPVLRGRFVHEQLNVVAVHALDGLGGGHDGVEDGQTFQQLLIFCGGGFLNGRTIGEALLVGGMCGYRRDARRPHIEKFGNGAQPRVGPSVVRQGGGGIAQFAGQRQIGVTHGISLWAELSDEAGWPCPPGHGLGDRLRFVIPPRCCVARLTRSRFGIPACRLILCDFRQRVQARGSEPVVKKRAFHRVSGLQPSRGNR